MSQKIYQIDAFTHRVFSGNPAAVCPLSQWLPDDLLQHIAAENNLAETAFYVKKDGFFELRWFTPTVEVDLCGHATLAAAYVLFHHEDYSGNTVRFHSPRSGALTVTRDGDFLTLNFPADRLEQVDLSPELRNCFDRQPRLAFKGKTDYLLVFEDEADIVHARPNLEAIVKLPARGVIISARGTEVDFVSRFFAPQVGVSEDPVTGSAHTSLIPYWAGELGKTELTARQLSARKGELKGRLSGDRVDISGQARLYLTGEIVLD